MNKMLRKLEDCPSRGKDQWGATGRALNMGHMKGEVKHCGATHITTFSSNEGAGIRSDYVNRHRSRRAKYFQSTDNFFEQLGVFQDEEV